MYIVHSINLDPKYLNLQIHMYVRESQVLHICISNYLFLAYSK
jgi:hypothetical protein